MSASAPPHLDRRSFLVGGAVIGAGLYVGIRIAENRFDKDAAAQGQVFQPNAFLRISPDDSVTVIIGKSEMGQGVYTGLAMAAAEELDIDPRRVTVEFAPADPAFNVPFAPVQFTGGSMSTSTTYLPLREAGARARAMLVAAAAKRWRVAAGALRTEDGRVFDGDRSLSYGALAEAASKEAVPAEVTLKDPAQFRYLGKPQKRLDAPMKVDGSAKFGLDMRLPQMWFAVVERPPVIGAKLRKVDDGAARAIPGVVEVKEIPSGVAVYATSTWAARRGREALVLEWDEGPNKNLSTAALRAEFRRLAGQPGAVASERGDVRGALAGAAQRMDVEYELPYLAHAPMEPLNCLAHARADGCDLYYGTQMQSPDRDAVAEALGLDPASVKVHTAFLGGGFGRRAQRYSEVAVEAAHASRAAGRPVQVVWTREDDVRGLSYRPFVVSRIRAGVDSQGNAVAWQQCIVSQPVLRGGRFESFIPKGSAFDPSSVEGASDMPYSIPNLLVDTHEGNRTVPILWWRSVGHSHTAFTVNCGMDELAALAGADPVEFRRKLLGQDSRFLAVLDKAAQMSGWGTPLPAGRGRGIAIQHSFGSIVAEVAEVSVRDSDVRVHKVWCAIDCGFAANPSGVVAQMESAINYGLTAALYGEITFENGRVQQSNFHDYPILRIDAAPEIEVAIINSGADKMGGAGEPGTPPIAPAVANAIYAATGRRIRKLPISRNFT
ncbi:MAG TPA: xanthine dehydrogenase family protein molybdopterin-binding subunit [Steroidobacteraceae bacterium]|jgi:isoquinoline 1-oxidoreductase beta subunit|nr:xanthine dehydrogenase family protein molybdopterin-binding subunit [Steroidobacteraceae bacterium]